MNKSQGMVSVDTLVRVADLGAFTGDQTRWSDEGGV
jgi:hypothetical protein